MFLLFKSPSSWDLGAAALAIKYTDFVILHYIDVWMNIYFVSGTVLDVGNAKPTKSSSLPKVPRLAHME